MNLHGSKRNSSLLLIAFSMIAVAIGIYQFTTKSVDCDGQTMHKGEICQSETDRGTDRGANIDQQRDANLVFGAFAVIGGLLAGGYAVRNLILIRKAPKAVTPQVFPMQGFSSAPPAPPHGVNSADDFPSS